ncbi:hypothetical protein [Mesorhizobium sp. M0227]|uniref:hypothetical protein n=1 Tax=Mesorhizobium sp. M0227 TaxID=2956922 RepID=UPI003337F9FD
MHPIVVRGAQVVVAAFGLFGGFIANISPPDHIASTGLASILTLIAFLLIVATARGQDLTAEVQRDWIRISARFFAGALILFLIYFFAKGALVFAMPSGQEVVGGLWFSARALEVMHSQQVSDPAEVLGIFGGVTALHDVWPFWSHSLAQLLLYALYVASVLSTLSALFCVSEGIFGDAGGSADAKPTSDDPPLQ